MTEIYYPCHWKVTFEDEKQLTTPLNYLVVLGDRQRLIGKTELEYLGYVGFTNPEMQVNDGDLENLATTLANISKGLFVISGLPEDLRWLSMPIEENGVTKIIGGRISPLPEKSITRFCEIIQSKVKMPKEGLDAVVAHLERGRK
ncbi:hypothetical protein HY448_02595 [Candidatus Pacearchaeota archaeon]|nr:hypothetical protein [Candidatus Pacearchaeota archaeon]